ncbi:MAG: peptidylprolyl isomerase [Verrucomicrobiota bacterium]|jgi:peptidyl-prolyl cis-trans isomerase SurA|nr:MAG: peptidylprolyl isomerase [Verrucomicrobiota bacterium]
MTLRRFSTSLLFIAGTCCRVLAQTEATQTAIAPGDNLNLRYADGIVAIVEEKVITVDDVRHEIQPLVAQLQKEARNEQEFNQRLEQLQDSVIQQLIDKVLIIKAFRKHKEGEDEKQIPASFIDNRIAGMLSDQFDNDRSKFLAYLRSRGMTMREYRKDIEEDIIYHYMRQQQEKSVSIVSPVKIEQFYKENKDQFYQEDSIHLRLIQLNKTDTESAEGLRARAQAIITRFNAGEKFEDLAKELSEDTKRSKGGDWGWMKRTDLKPEFADPIFVLKKNNVTDAIMTPDGCFVLFVEDRKYAGIQPLDQVREQIEHILMTQTTQTDTEHWLERLRRTGYVKHF